MAERSEALLPKSSYESGLSQAGGLGGFRTPVFGQTVNPISTMGVDYAHHSTTSPPGFSDLATGLSGGPPIAAAFD